jgi:hypothetical protein
MTFGMLFMEKDATCLTLADTSTWKSGQSGACAPTRLSPHDGHQSGVSMTTRPPDSANTLAASLRHAAVAASIPFPTWPFTIPPAAGAGPLPAPSRSMHSESTPTASRASLPPAAPLWPAPTRARPAAPAPSIVGKLLINKAALAAARTSTPRSTALAAASRTASTCLASGLRQAGG